MGALPTRAAHDGDQVDALLDQVKEEGGPVVGWDPAVDDPKAALVEPRSRVGPARNLLGVDRHHRELRLGPNPAGELVEPGVVESTTLRDGHGGQAIACRTTGGRWLTSP